MYDHDFEVDENFDFNFSMNELLNQEVEKRLEAKISGYHSAMEREKMAVQKQYEQERTIRELERKLKEAETTFFKQGADQTKRELMGGFKLGDKVWFIGKKYKTMHCKTCSGKGKLEVRAIAVAEPFQANCPDCQGRAQKSNYEYSVEQGNICEIKVHTWAKEKCFEGTFYIEPTTYKANNSVECKYSSLFHTEEECQQAINGILNA
ncbi:hypothetical protein [Brevibacillus sp. HD1.4A]|uniref:hypothetical protein n=1 Tax=Brevibacillus sp. HD1.4A TaxID=2738978 RepID=UPI00156B8E0E|nr:hypothetical protein [Brevibacillus sp. HD1.4A]NRQ51961.1 hypothetical protein [Brevibacillus sp. HD1.4A]